MLYLLSVLNLLISAHECSRPRIISSKFLLLFSLSYTSFWRCGSSCLQGPHQVAKKLIHTTLPFSSESFFVCPFSVANEKSGAVSPTFTKVNSSCAKREREKVKRQKRRNKCFVFIFISFDVISNEVRVRNLI